MNQPLQIVLASAEFLSASLPSHDPNYEVAVTIQNNVERLGDVTRRIMNITKVRTHEYLSGENQIVDLAESSPSNPINAYDQKINPCCG